VRELENAIEYAFVKAREGLIGPDHLPPELRDFAAAPEHGLRGPHRVGAPEASSDREGQQQRAAEPETVRQTLSATGWNVAKAARRLGVSRTTLYKRIAEFGIQRPEQ
jgi:transcriptional regulator of acetoin/glycerol metabolism